MTLRLRYVAHSEVGLVRKNNQDSGYASPTMLVVADGMGGAAAGDLASAVAIRELREADVPHEGEAMLESFVEAIHRANDQIADQVGNDSSLDGMGTTVCGAMFDGTQLGLAHIGDSRGYRYRDGDLTRLTRDHSWVQQLIDEGRITESEALVHPHRSLILKVLNGQPNNEPDVALIDVVEGDRLLFCSDGLCGLVEDDKIAEILAKPDLDDVMSDLIAAAHEGGGLDNITIVLADLTTDEVDLTPVILGAALTQEIPDVGNKTLDLGGDEDTVRQDAAGNPLPAAPPPVSAAAAERARYAPVPPRRGRAVRFVLATAIALVILAAIVGGLYSAARQYYFVGANVGRVAIFQGWPATPTATVFEQTAVSVTDLPQLYQLRVLQAQYPAGSLEAARSTVNELALIEAKCKAARNRHTRATATPTPSPTISTASPSVTPGTTPLATPRSETPNTSPTGTSASPTTSPSPTPTPSPTEPPAPKEC